MANNKECFWRCMCLIMGVFFTLASLVQHNDPDWFLWIPIYALPACISFIQVSKFKIRETPKFQIVVKFALFLYSVLDIKLFAQLISNQEDKELLDINDLQPKAAHVNESIALQKETESSKERSSTSRNSSFLATEEGREFLGSLIITVWLVLCCLQFTRVKDISLGCRLLIISFVVLPFVIWFIHVYYGIDLC